MQCAAHRRMAGEFHCVLLRTAHHAAIKLVPVSVTVGWTAETVGGDICSGRGGLDNYNGSRSLSLQRWTTRQLSTEHCVTDVTFACVSH